MAPSLSLSVSPSQNAGHQAARPALPTTAALVSLLPWLASLAVLALLALLALAPPAAHAARSTRYVFINDTIGTPGTQVVDEADDGLVSVTFRYKNNGRGPELTEQYRLAPDGSFSEYHVQGRTTMNAVVDEHFQRKGNGASWRSTSERGTTTLAGAGLYVPVSGSMAPYSVFIGALARQAGGSMPLLPNGTLSQRKLDDVEVQSASGQKQRVQLLVQTGLGLQPLFVWATTGPAPRLFAFDAFAGEIFIEEGWQANRALLEARQLPAEKAVLLDLAQRLRHPLPGLTVVRNARVFDSVRAALQPPSDVYVLRGRITAVLPAGAPLGAPGGEPDNVIDAAGRVLLPGLFDMHGHISRWDGSLNLAAGVTTVRDLGNDNATMQQLLDEVAAGVLLSPQPVPCGFLEGKSPFSASQGITIGTLAEAKAAVDWYAQRGYPQLKIYNSFPPPLLRDTVAYAHSRGMRVSGHVPAFMRAQDVVEQGFDEIQHINQVLLNFLVTPSTDTRSLERFRLPAAGVVDLDFDAPAVRDFVALLAQRKTVVDPTLSAFDFIKQRDGELAAPFAAVADHLPPDVKRGLFVGGMDIADDATAERYRRSYAKMVEFVGRLYRAGVPLVAGTDNITGFALHAELVLYVQAGLTPAQALQVATLNGATYTRTLADRGSISAGKLADLVLVDGDPTQNIEDIRKVALVLTQGHWLAPRDVHQAIGIQPFVTSVPAVRRKAR